MNKAQFIAELRRRISQLPPAEIEKSAAYYEEMIDDRIEDGKTEEQAVAELEDVEVIAERILRETPIHTLVKTKVQPKGGWSAAAIVLAVLGAPLWLPLLAAAACIVLVLYVLVWSVLVTFIALVLALILSGAAILIASVVLLSTSPLGGLFLSGCALICIGFGILFVLGVKGAVSGAVRLSARIGRSIKSAFIRKER